MTQTSETGAAIGPRTSTLERAALMRLAATEYDRFGAMLSSLDSSDWTGLPSAPGGTCGRWLATHSAWRNGRHDPRRPPPAEGGTQTRWDIDRRAHRAASAGGIGADPGAGD